MVIFVGEWRHWREADLQTDNSICSGPICEAFKAGGKPRGCGGAWF